MAYNRSIPQPTDLISNSQAQVLGNFQTIDSGSTSTGVGFSRNHVTMADATNGGLHNRVDYYQSVSSPTVSGFVSSLYPNTTTNTELFYKNSVADIQITNSALTASSGQGMLPGGLQIRAGSCSANGSGIVNSFSPAFPNACVSVVATGGNAALTTNVLKVTSISASSFTLKSSSGESGFYIAIGY